jgi:UDP-2,3-diacylglucosamine pyrophosphatase LpxH
VKRHTVAISDIHLSEHEPTSGLWMRYRQKDYTPGAEIAAMLEELCSRVRGDELTLVLNGDVFDLDAPTVRDGRSVHHDLPRDAAHAAPVMAAILRDHQDFVAGLGHVLADGHTIVLVSGNHDALLTLPEVREEVRRAVVGAARRRTAESEEALSARVLFRAWFHRTADGMVFEHGHQYDSFCSYRYPMAPFGKKPGTVQPTLGSLTSRLYMARLGYFNPHVDESFVLTAGGYFRHWAKYYLFSKHSQSWIWLSFAMRTLASLVSNRDPGSRERRLANIAAAAAETGASLRSVARHARLFAAPGEDILWTCARELWLDRALLAGVAAGSVAAWALFQHHAFGVLATLGPVAMLAVEVSSPKGTLGDNWRKVQRRARQVAKVHKASAVVFGHTHNPEGMWQEGVFYGNTGSWSAAYRDVECKEPLFEERPLVWLTSDEGALSGGLCMWKKGMFRFTSSAQTPDRVC